MIPLPRQREIVQENMVEAFPELVGAIANRSAMLERLAMARLEEAFDIHGDALFTRAADRIERELDEELADALVYTCALLWRRYEASR